MITHHSPEIKNAIIIEDDSKWQIKFKSVLEDMGWIVVGQATNMDDALKLIKKIDELQVTLVLLDGQLIKSNRRMRETYPEEGGRIAREIKVANPNMTILGVSGAFIFQNRDPNITARIGKELSTVIPGIKKVS